MGRHSQQASLSRSILPLGKWYIIFLSYDLLPGPGFNGIVIDYDLVLRHGLTTKIFVNQAVIYDQIVDFTIVNAIAIPLNPGPGN